MRRSTLLKLVSIGEVVIGLSAVAGGYGLITLNGLGMPVSWLATAPFTSYVLPGIILAGIVGGTHLIAAILIWKQWQFYHEAMATAGFGLLIWIFTEMYIVRHSHWLQVVYFSIGIFELVFVMLLLKYRKKVKI